MSNPPVQERSPLEINEPDTGAQPPGIGWEVDDDNAQLQLRAVRMLSDLPNLLETEVAQLDARLSKLFPPEAMELRNSLARAISQFELDRQLFINLSDHLEDAKTSDQRLLQAIDTLSSLPGAEAAIARLQGERSRWLTFTRLMGQNDVIPMRTLPRRLFVINLASIYTRLEYARTGEARQLTQADFKYSRKRCSGFVSFLLSVFGAVTGLTTLSGDVSDSQVRVFKNKLDQYWQDYHNHLNQIERDFQEPME